MAAYAAPQSYQQNAVLTAPPGRLVVMLYDGAGRFLRRAVARHASRRHRALQRLAPARRGDHRRAARHARTTRRAARSPRACATCTSSAAATSTRRASSSDHEKIDAVVGLLAELRDALGPDRSRPAGTAA